MTTPSAIVPAVATAWRVTVAPGSGTANCLAEFPEPLGCVMTAEAVPPLQVLAETSLTPSGSGQPDGKSLVFVFVPAGSEFGVYEEWFKRGIPADGSIPVLDVALPDRILWRPGRAVMFGSAERRDEILKALAVFSYLESEVRDLESGVQRHWGFARQDAALTHRVGGKSLNEWPRVCEITEWAALSRLKFSAVDATLYMPPSVIGPKGRRMLLELARLTRMPDRLEFVDDQIQVFEELYRQANDRLSDYRYYRRELQLEAAIIILLVMQAIVMVVEIVKGLPPQVP